MNAMAHASNGQSLRIYLIRHAEAEGSTNGRLLGFTDPPLSSEGREQALWLAQELAGAHISAVYSSDLLRAKSTAEAIAEHLMRVEQLRLLLTVASVARLSATCSGCP